MITKAERKEAEKLARTYYQDVLNVEVKEDPDDESSLILIVTRGKKMPPICLDRSNKTLKNKKV